MSGTAAQNAIAVVGVDIGKNSFHVVALDDRGAIVLRQKWSRNQVEARFANLPPCLIGMEACVGAHHLSRKLNSLGHDARLMPAKYVRPYTRRQKNDFRDAEAIAEAVQRPTMKFVVTKTAEQLDLQALHRVRERLVSQRQNCRNAGYNNVGKGRRGIDRNWNAIRHLIQSLYRRLPYVSRRSPLRFRAEWRHSLRNTGTADATQRASDLLIQVDLNQRRRSS